MEAKKLTGKDIDKIVVDIRLELAKQYPSEVLHEVFREHKIIANIPALIETAYKAGIKEAIAVYEPYIELLGKEIDALLGIVVAHGWHSSNIGLGAKHRERLAKLKE